MGGEILTFDQLAVRSPVGKNTLLIRAPARLVLLRGISALLESLAATSSLSPDPRDASSSPLVVAGNPVVTRSSLDCCTKNSFDLVFCPGRLSWLRKPYITSGFLK